MFSLHKYFTTFFYLFIYLFIYYFQLLKFITFFLYFFYPRHLPTPTTDDLYPLPTTFSYAGFAFDTSPKNIAPCSNVWVRGMTYFAWLLKFIKYLQKNFHIVLDVFHHLTKWNLKWLTPTFSRNLTVGSHWKFC